MRHAGWRAAAAAESFCFVQIKDSFPGASPSTAINASNSLRGSVARPSRAIVQPRDRPKSWRRTLPAVEFAGSAARSALRRATRRKCVVLSEMKATAIAASGPAAEYEALCELDNLS